MTLKLRSTYACQHLKIEVSSKHVKHAYHRERTVPPYMYLARPRYMHRMLGIANVLITMTLKKGSLAFGAEEKSAGPKTGRPGVRCDLKACRENHQVFSPIVPALRS